MSINYQQIYDNLIELGRSERTCIEFNEQTGLYEIDEYRENHHIIPKCFFKEGNKHGVLKENMNLSENLVLLTGREHFVAHQLLVKIYPKEYGLIEAVTKMTLKGKGQEVGRSNNRLYAWLKKKASLARKDKTYEEFYGEEKAKEIKVKIKAKRAKQVFKPRSTASRKKTGDSNRGKVRTEEHKDNMKAGAIGRIMPPCSDEKAKKISDTQKGRANKNKNKTYEEIYGIEKAAEIKGKMKHSQKEKKEIRGSNDRRATQKENRINQ